MLKVTKIKLELITDSYMYIFLGKGVRGAIFYVSNRYSKTNNKYLKHYDSTKNQNILYIKTQISCMVIQCLNFF